MQPMQPKCGVQAKHTCEGKYNVWERSTDGLLRNWIRSIQLLADFKESLVCRLLEEPEPEVGSTLKIDAVAREKITRQEDGSEVQEVVNTADASLEAVPVETISGHGTVELDQPSDRDCLEWDVLTAATANCRKYARELHPICCSGIHTSNQSGEATLPSKVSSF